MKQQATPFIESIKEIVRQLTLLLVAVFFTSGIDIIVEVLGDIQVSGLWQIVLTAVIQLILRGRDKYKYYQAKQAGEQPNQLLMIK